MGGDTAITMQSALTEKYCEKKNDYVNFAASILRSFSLSAQYSGEDVVHNVFSRLMEKNGSLMANGNLDSFVRTSIKRECIDLGRYVARKRTASIDNFCGEEFLAKKQTKFPPGLYTFMIAAIGKLPDAYRDSFTKHYFDGESYETISKRTGISASTIRVEVFRAKEILKRYVASEFPEVARRFLANGNA